jgi:aspartyl-tRNA(Asn)/glutamyl-tRNA(Gln) amidotransferase subunit A
LVNKEFRALEAVQAYYARIKERDGEIGAYLSLAEEQAARAAEEVDLAIERGEEIGPLAGAPIALKDNILVKGLPATAGSKILEKYTASYDAGVTQRLRSEHAVFLGKTNPDEFAMGTSTENSAFQVTRNPRDPERVPGGSSGGSAAAVAGEMALAALGSDTGGSVRQPAAFCGVVGLKPTYGAVSRSGLIALTSSLDQIGPITKTAADAALVFRAIAGHDPMDSTSAPVKYDEELLRPDFKQIANLKIGVPREYFIDGMNADVRGTVERVIKEMEGLGIKTEPVSLPHTGAALACYYIINPAEASSNLARFDGLRYAQMPDEVRELLAQRGAGFGPEPTRRIILGTFVLSSGYYDAYYRKAQEVRTLIKKDFDQAFEKVDVILAPTAPNPAFKIGEKADDPLSLYLEDVFTVPASLAGVPAVSIPAKGREGKLPIGFQLIGRHFREADILGLGQLYEKS